MHVLTPLEIMHLACACTSGLAAPAPGLMADCAGWDGVWHACMLLKAPPSHPSAQCRTHQCPGTTAKIRPCHLCLLGGPPPYMSKAILLTRARRSCLPYLGLLRCA